MMIRKLYLVIVCLVGSICCLSQSDTKDFLLYLLNHYLPSKGLYKINDKSDHAFFAKRYDILLKRIEVVMKSDTGKDIQSIRNDFLRYVRSSAVKQSYQDLFFQHQLFSIDSFYYVDSIRNDFENKYSKAVRDSQKIGTVHTIPIPSEETPAALRIKANEAFTSANAFIEHSVEVTVPYIFNNRKNCLIIYVRHLNYWPEAKVLLFERLKNNWSFKRVVFDQELFLDDETDFSIFAIALSSAQPLVPRRLWGQ